MDGLTTLAEQYGMFPRGCTVLCAVSGGADSVYLLHRLCRLAPRWGIRVAAAHFNHRLRGEESDRDEAFVRSLVRDLCPAELAVGSGDVAGEAARLGRGIEETARQLRYDFLRRTAEELGAGVIATAHNADDNAETVLMALLRGTGLRGLTGIAPRQGQLVRPLLTTTRAEIEAYLERWGLPHVEDSSNRDDAYLRNRVRHRLIPLLEEWNPGFTDRMTATIPTLRADNELLDRLAAERCRCACREGEELTIPVSAISQAPAAVAPRCVRLLLGRMREGDMDCSMAHLEAVTALCRSDSPSARADLPNGLTVRRAYDKLIFSAAPPPPPLAELIPGAGETPVPHTGWAAVLDCPPWPGLVVRPRRTGDEIVLPGRPRRSLKQLFIDRKVPRAERERIPVAADDDGVAAVAGFGPNTAHPMHGHITFIKKEVEEA